MSDICIDDFHLFLYKYKNPKTFAFLSGRNIKNCVRVIKSLVEGKGVKSKNAVGVFMEGEKLTLAHDIYKVKQDAKQWLPDKKDKSNGWVIKHPLQKLIFFKQQYLMNTNAHVIQVDRTKKEIIIQQKEHQQREKNLKKRIKIAFDDFESENSLPLTKRQKQALKERIKVENKQELACIGYLQGGVSQYRLKLEDSYIIADVVKDGIPWEVKKCDSIHLVQHAFGQSSFQKFFAQSNSSGLWLFTKDIENGVKNFNLLVKMCVPTFQIVLAKQVEPIDCELVSFEEANKNVIATYDSIHGVKWMKQLESKHCDKELFDTPLRPC